MSKKNQAILIVEDELQDAEFTIKALRQTSDKLSFIHISDVDDLRGFDYQAQQISMIFLDMKMPKVTGLELLHLIMDNQDTKQIPIVVLSSSSMPKQEKEAKKMGIYDFIVKPINIDQYYAVVKNVYWSIVKGN